MQNDASVILEISSSNKGLLIPRMNFDQIKNIVQPSKGFMAYDSTTNNFYFLVVQPNGKLLLTGSFLYSIQGVGT